MSVARPVIAIDVDDVLAHSVEHFRQSVNKKTGSALTPDHFKVPGPYHKYFQSILESNGIDHESIKDDLFQSMVNDQTRVMPQPGAIAALQALAQVNDLVVITARPPEWEPQTHIWLESHYPGVFKNVYFAGNRHDPTGKTKGQMCVEVGAGYLIDDNPEHCLAAIESGVTPILFGEFGWHVNIPIDMVRCKNWNEVQEFFGAART